MKKIVAICALAIMSLTTASAANSNTFNSVQAAKDVSLDTNPESAFWRGAIPAYLEVDNFGKRVPRYRTEVLSRWTKGQLYFLFVCPYQKLNLKPGPHTDKETNQLWNWDVAEVFIGSDFKNIRHYKEFEISPQGEWIDLDVNLDKPHHEDGWVWNSGFQVTSRIDTKKKIWYGAMRIPFIAIAPHSPRPGNSFRVNMFRTEGPAPKTKSIVWQPTMNETFHVPERFGTLVLVPNK
ncbi:MAG TPA: carbohydrate-binding family 9-like protein [Acidobacteriaceae bacterium]|nr:carbohydrate-binding family 9-like protein [Acidobacteriaceae bacterium]